MLQKVHIQARNELRQLGTEMYIHVHGPLHGLLEHSVKILRQQNRKRTGPDVTFVLRCPIRQSAVPVALGALHRMCCSAADGCNQLLYITYGWDSLELVDKTVVVAFQ